MRKLFGTCGTLLSFVCAAQAQTPTDVAALHTLQAEVTQVAPSSACAVGFAVTRLPAQTLRPAAGGTPHMPHGTALDLSLAPLQTSAIRSVSVTVYGLLGPTFLPVGKANSGQGSEDLTLALWSKQGSRAHSKAYPVRISGVQQVELREILFADGSAWHEPATGSCRVAPNGFLLVAASH